MVIGLAAVGASLGVRKMYVKALLKLFEYATNINQEKQLKDEDLIEDDGKNDLEKTNQLKRLKRLRSDTFMLKPATKSENGESDGLEENNNYLNTNKLHSLIEEQQQKCNTTLKQRGRTLSELRKNFQLGDVIDFVHNGLESIVDDEVTKRFSTDELTVWNLLSRTNQQYEYVSFRVTCLWLFGFMLRYCLLFPARLILFIFACIYTFVSTFLIGLIKEQSKFKRTLNWYATLVLHRILSRVFSAIITFHNPENKAKPGSICVANHTSPIDVIILSTNNCYSMIGQEHGGFTGMMQRAFSRSANHIWFDRTEAKDRGAVARRMRQHVQDKTNCPILIFPEGTCINNTSVMMFKKGCFEIDTTIYPVAIKYDLRFGDAFWNSTKHTMLQYLILMMTSWAIVVDVYYLPPMEKMEGEDAAQFALRVKSEIVKKGSFVDLHWDGMIKRAAPKLDLMYEQQQKYVSQLKLD